MRHSRYLIAVLMLLTCAVLPVRAAEEKNVVAVTGGDSIQRVTVTAGSYFFDPNRITVKANMKVEMTVMKESSLTPHDIEMKSPEAGMEFSEGLSSTPKVISFTPTKPGTYPFFCGKKLPLSKSHRERGMEGIIEVLP
jgi:plastocyanin domain-containing protein